MNEIVIELDCGIITLELTARTNDVGTVKEQIDKFLTFGETLYDEGKDG